MDKLEKGVRDFDDVAEDSQMAAVPPSYRPDVKAIIGSLPESAREAGMRAVSEAAIKTLPKESAAVRAQVAADIAKAVVGESTAAMLHAVEEARIEGRTPEESEAIRANHEQAVGRVVAVRDGALASIAATCQPIVDAFDADVLNADEARVAAFTREIEAQDEGSRDVFLKKGTELANDRPAWFSAVRRALREHLAARPELNQWQAASASVPVTRRGTFEGEMNAWSRTRDVLTSALEGARPVAVRDAEAGLRSVADGLSGKARYRRVDDYVLGR